MVDATGAAGLTGMTILDRGHTTRFGHPEPTAVSGAGWGICAVLECMGLPLGVVCA